MPVPWNKNERERLVRLMDKQVADVVRLPRRVNVKDLLEEPDGRLRLIQMLYEALAGMSINYALEEYNSEKDVQSVRRPREVVGARGQGTCLDLAILFCSLCLAHELAPILVVTDRHAYVAVVTTRGERDWDSYDWPGFDDDEFLTDDIEQLRRHVTTEAGQTTYLAVECTGFARSTSLTTGHESVGRTADGLLPYEAALAAGWKQVFERDDDLRFAIDIARAWHDKNLRSETVVVLTGGDTYRIENRDGDAVVIPDDDAGLEWLPEPTPLRARGLGAIDVLFDRIGQPRRTMATHLTPGSLAGFYGERGTGKTALLSALAHGDFDPSVYPDGVVDLRTQHLATVDEALEQVHRRFYSANRAVKHDPDRDFEDLKSKRALVLLDDFAFDEDSHDALKLAMPLSTFILTVTDLTRLGTAPGVPVKELEPHEVVRLFEHVYYDGKAKLNEVDRPEAANLAKGRRFNAGDIVTWASYARNEGLSVSALSDRIEAAEFPEALLTSSLLEAGTWLIEVMRQVDAPIPTAFLEHKLGDEADLVLDELEERHLALASSPRYRVAATLARPRSGDHGDSDRAAVTPSSLLADVAAWAEAQSEANVVAREREFVINVLEWALRGARKGGPDADSTWKGVLRLARAVEYALAAEALWDSWGEVLDVALEAARRLGDVSAEAWALHQQAARLLSVRRRREGRRLLARALDLRHEQGEAHAAARSWQNFRLLLWTALVTAFAAIVGSLALFIPLIDHPTDHSIDFGAQPLCTVAEKQIQIQADGRVGLSLSGEGFRLAPPTASDITKCLENSGSSAEATGSGGIKAAQLGITKAGAGVTSGFEPGVPVAFAQQVPNACGLSNAASDNVTAEVPIDSCTVSIFFMPRAARSFDGSMDVSRSGADVVSVTLSGSGDEPTANVQPTTPTSVPPTTPTSVPPTTPTIVPPTAPTTSMPPPTTTTSVPTTSMPTTSVPTTSVATTTSVPTTAPTTTTTTTGVATTTSVPPGRPVGVGDSYTVAEGGKLDVGVGIGVLANDSDPNGDALTAERWTRPSNGTVELRPNGSFTYTHDGSETVDDAFTYRVSDGSEADVATVTITVTPVNDPPSAMGDDYDVDRGETIEKFAGDGVLSNDSDVDSDSLTALLVEGPAHADSFVLNEDGSFTYDHDGSAATNDVFTYRVSDGSASDVATVTLAIVEGVADISPEVLDFGDVLTGTTSGAMTATLTNVGTGTLTVMSPVLNGPNFELTAATDCVAGTLARGEECTVTVVFKPTAPPSFHFSSIQIPNGSIIDDDDTILLLGTGIL